MGGLKTGVEHMRLGASPSRSEPGVTQGAPSKSLICCSARRASISRRTSGWFGKVPHYVGPASNLLVQPLSRVVRPDLLSMSHVGNREGRDVWPRIRQQLGCLAGNVRRA